VLEKRCWEGIETTLFVGTINNQFEYFTFSYRRKDAEVWRWFQRWRIVRSPRRVGGQCQAEL